MKNSYPIDKMIDLYRLAKFGKLSAGIFHELATPITQLLLEINTVPANLKRPIQKMYELSTHINKLLTYQTQPTPQAIKIFHPNTEIISALQLLSFTIKKYRIAVSYRSKPDIMLYGNKSQWNLLVLNIIAQGVSACTGHSQERRRNVTISLKQNKNQCVFQVHHTGTTIKKTSIKKIFAPFYSAKPAADTIGLGLATAAHIVRKTFRGSITATSTLKKGTFFTVTIPQKTYSLAKIILLLAVINPICSEYNWIFFMTVSALSPLSGLGTA